MRRFAGERRNCAPADRLRPAYVAACSTLGRTVRVELPTGEPLEVAGAFTIDGRGAAFT